MKSYDDGASKAIGVRSSVPRGVLFFFSDVCAERGSYDGGEVAVTPISN